MSHIDPEQLALLALGTARPDAADEAHLLACPTCRDDHAMLQRAASTARSTLGVGELIAPPERVWLRIREEVDLATPVAEPADEPAAERPTASGGAPALRRDARIRPRAARSGASRSWLRSSWILAATVAVVAVAGTSIWAVTSGRPDVVAEARLAAFPTHPGAAGTATLAERDGEEVLRVDVSDLPTETDAHNEVWLLSESDGSPVSLGRLDGSSGVFTIPAGVDLRDYAIVDVSLEPDDGDATHSGDSITRGTLS